MVGEGTWQRSLGEHSLIVAGDLIKIAIFLICA